MGLMVSGASLSLFEDNTGNAIQLAENVFVSVLQHEFSLFDAGLLGGSTSSERNRRVASKLTEGSAHLGLGIAEEIDATVLKRLHVDLQSAGIGPSASRQRTLEVMPRVIINAASRDRSTLHVLLRTRVVVEGKEVWWTRVSGAADDIRPVRDWIVSRESFLGYVQQALARASRGVALLTRRDELPFVAAEQVQGAFPWYGVFQGTWSGRVGCRRQASSTSTR
jgi:hypothetical protein